MKFRLMAGVVALAAVTSACTPSVTTVSGTHAPVAVCSGALIFADDFEQFDLEKWQHENTLAGGGNWEFQYYSNNRTNSFTNNGILYIRPSLTSDQFGEGFLSSGHLNVEEGATADRCTNPQWYGCDRTGTPTNILNPIKSAQIQTKNSFNFRYGRVEVRAKLPAGDWLWPAIWLLPAFNTYGSWPSSGEIDLMESRGNRNLTLKGVNIGVQEVDCSLHFGPRPDLDAWQKTTWSQRRSQGFNEAFHNYQLEWTPDFLKFCIDNEEIGKAVPGTGGFWEYGKFNNNDLNPWKYGTKMAPFDQKFYLIINVAVGGTNGYFPDSATNPSPKPWKDSSTTAATDFWKSRDAWLPTWNLDKNNGWDASLQIDYVKVWAL
ncbi:beta-1,3-glucan-binding protein-like isoform X1 [Leptidea sinapis]|uniref:beta-1,3-glucan-binding protein-like isoform X1 n=1 Tax=Leptidea sinapis TaxID=189913 RepID=UPI0021C324C0|nr:beta-1,3-glucan-binding protein-like isoform X1 [Leptidea sinapis]